MKNKVHPRSALKLLLACACFTAASTSMAGACYTLPGTPLVSNVVVGNVLDSLESGQVIPNIYWHNLSGGGMCPCTNGWATSQYLTYKTPLQSGQSGMVNGARRTFYKVGDGTIQVALDILYGGSLPVPITNNRWSMRLECKHSNGAEHNTPLPGNEGRLHLLITQPFIGVKPIPRTLIATTHMGYNDPLPSDPPTLRYIYVSGAVTVPQSCQLVPGQNLSIDFGRRIVDQLALPGQAGIGPVKRSFNIQCKNIKSGVNVDLFLEAQPQAKDKRYITTSHNNIGIAVESHNKLIAPTLPGARPGNDQKLPIELDYGAQRAQFDMSAYPVRMVEKPSTGAYHGSATVKFEFQ